TPKGTPTPIIFPNPAPGPTVNILPPPYSGPSFVRVEIFTLAFRKVLDRFFYNIPSGVSVQVNLADRWGSPLASGIYYVVVTTSSGRSIGKLLILR
ncbi:MAG TPA: T9SS type A sorting domain-containing protein, partial [bacterium]